MYKSKKIKAILLLICFSTITANEPTSPDFSGYTAVGNNQIVNKFTGGLNYSIPIVVVPGPDGSDYQIALSYSSGVQPDQQASWVGYGWSLSPGAITRQKKGFPDDYNDQEIKYWQKFRPSLTASKNVMIRSEFLSVDANDIFGDVFEGSDTDIGLSANYSRSVTFNNMNGYSVQTTLGAGAGAFGSLSATWNQKGVPTYFYDLNIVALLRKLVSLNDKNPADVETMSFTERSLNRLENQAIGVLSAGHSTRSVYNAITSKGSGKFPSSTSEFVGTQYTFAPTFGVAYGFQKTEGEPGLTITEIEQKPLLEQPRIKKGFGYMNSYNATNSKDVMDYFTEKQSEFNKDDKFLPIPFSNADNFYVTCKDLGGSFRAWSRYVEEYRPNEIKSEAKSSDYGSTLVVGTDGSINFGIGYGDGGSTSKTSGWLSDNYNTRRNKDYTGNSIPKYFFKFHNDLGYNKSFYSGNVDLGDYHSPEALDVVANIAGYLNNLFSVPLPTPNHSKINFNSKLLGGHNELLHQSKSISYNTNSNLFYDSYNIRKFSKNSEYIEGIKDDIITEFKITNEEGKSFIFGKPVFSRNERSISYGITSLNHITPLEELTYNEATAYTIDNKLVYQNITPLKDKKNIGNPPEVILGQEMEEPYASSYLITEILSTNYVDIENDGPSKDDLGGYTIFDYEQVYGSKNKSDGADYNWDAGNGEETETSNWYRWRTPVGGFYYDRNSQSDRGDDMISFSSGEKEVYNLEAISTKTHVAFFVNNMSDIEISFKDVTKYLEGSEEKRKDGYESFHSEWEAGASNTANISSSKNIRYLEKIELWKLDESDPFEIINGKKIYNVINKLQTTYFDYDYSSWSGIPSSEDGNGKLTLKKVWTESGDLKSDYHNPYVFDYQSNYISFPNYTGITAPTISKVEDPDYNNLNIDGWGNYRLNGLSNIEDGRSFQEQNWVFQNKSVYANSSYDPSAWNLKQIQLPSTGKIFVEYEENEYSSVQDEHPMTLVSIAENGYDGNNHKIRLDISNDLGLTNSNTTEINQIIDLIDKKYVNGVEKIYFNFLYSLVGPEVYNNIKGCASEYIDGFVKVSSVSYNDPNIEITFDNSEGVFIPEQICKDFFYSNRYGIYNPDLSIEPPCCKANSDDDINYLFLNMNNVNDILESRILNNTKEDKICRSVNKDLSYVRIPLPESFSKRGGGIRVKRVLYLDKFDERTGESGTTARMYGNEYIYQNTNGHSSGVAANEPQTLLKENPFYKPIVKRNNSSVYSAGNQVSNILGPFGASILPSASVGYSRVLSKSIFDNEHHPGFTIDSFLTYKDYPVYGTLLKGSDFDALFSSVGNNSSVGGENKELKGFTWTNINDLEKRYIRDPGFTLPAPYMNLSSSAQTSQGFQFINHNFNGKPIFSMTYGGRYNDPDTWNIGSSTEYEYFNIGERIPIIDKNFKLKETFIGRDEEIVMEGRFSENVTQNWKAEGDLTFFAFPFSIKEVGGYGNYSTFSKKLNTHTTNKIINYPAITRKVTTFADGVKTVKENAAFDIYTGQPFITRVNDKYSLSDRNDSYYQIIDIPTSYVYSEFSQKSNGISNKFIEHHMMNSSITRKIRADGSSNYYFINMDSQRYGGYSFEFINRFNESDIIEVSPANSSSDISVSNEYYRIKKVLSDVLVIVPIIDGSVQMNSISDLSCNIRIIESGKKNILNSKAAKIVKADNSNVLGNPIFNAISYNAELGGDQSNHDGIESIASSINTKLATIFNSITGGGSNEAYYKVKYDETYQNDRDYSGPLVIFPDTDSDLLSEPIPIGISPALAYPTPFPKHYNLKGEIEDLPPPILTIENLEFKLGEIAKYTANCQEEYLNIAFDLCWERLSKIDEIDYGNQVVVPNIFSDDLNKVINNSWHLKLSDILKEFGLYNDVNHIGTNSSFYQNISQEINIPNGKKEEFWSRISELIGVANINENNYSLNDDYNDYLELIDDDKIYIISYQESANNNKEIYFADILFKNTEYIIGSDNENIFGFIRNIGKSDPNNPFTSIVNPHYNNSTSTQYFNKFIIKDLSLSTIENTELEYGTNNSELFANIKNYSNFPVNSGGIEFIIEGDGSETVLNINYSNNSSSTSQIDFSESDVLPSSLLADKCCRTYLAVFKRNEYRPGGVVGISPFDVQTYNTNTKYFGFANGQLSDMTLLQEEICNNNLGKMGYDGVTDLEASDFCIRFAPDQDLVYLSENVYAATIADYKDEWESDKTSNFFDEADKYSLGRKGRWMSHKSYVYKNTIDNATAFTGSSKNSLDNKGELKHFNGTNDIVNHKYRDFVLFNWKIPEANDYLRWVSQSEITSVNSLNQPEQEESIIGVNSSVYYSESDLKPILYTNNANKDEIYFNSGDCDIPTSFSGPTIFGKPHSGNDLISMIPSNNTLDIEVEIDIQKTYIIKYWLYHFDGVPIGQQPLTVSITNKNALDPANTTSFTITDNSTNPIRVGNWDLITHEIVSNPPSNPNIINEVNITLTANGPGNYIDDLLFIPIDATSKCISYNCENDRVEAEFDSEHFATFFDYDNEGRLIRKRKETYRGVKNIAETYYNTPKVNVSNSGSSSGLIAPTKMNEIDSYRNNRNRFDNNININSGSSDEGTGNKFDIFDLKIDKDGINTKLFDTDTEEIKDNLDSLRKKVKDFKLDSLKKELNLESLDNTKDYKSKFNKEYNKLDSLQMPNMKLDTNGVENKLKNRIESEAIKNGNHNTKIRKGK